MSDGTALPLLLLPGTLCDEQSFAPLLEAAGMTGRFMPLEGARSAEAMAQKLLHQAPPRFDLMGFSLGAIIALEMVAQAPERVARLALFGANPGPMPAQRAEGRRVLLDRARIEGPEIFVDATWELAVPMGRRRDAELRARLRDMAERVGLRAFDDQTAMTIDRADSLPRLGRITAPTLVATGAEDRICPPEMSRQIAAGIKDAELLILPEAGHYALLERPEILAEAVARWRRRAAAPTTEAIEELS